MWPHKEITILVVDDELSIRESLRSWLEQDGYKVETAVDGPTALAMIQENHFEITTARNMACCLEFGWHNGMPL